MMTEEITPVKTYVLVALALVLLTGATIGVSYLPVGRLHGAVALALRPLRRCWCSSTL